MSGQGLEQELEVVQELELGQELVLEEQEMDLRAERKEIQVLLVLVLVVQAFKLGAQRVNNLEEIFLQEAVYPPGHEVGSAVAQRYYVTS